MEKILLIDDNTIYREGLKALFLNNASSYCVNEIPNYFNCFDYLSVRSNRPDYIIISIHDNNDSILSFISDLKKKRFRLKVIVLCNLNFPEYIQSIWNLNVDALLLSTTSFSDLLYVLKNVSRETFSHYVDPMIIPLINKKNMIENIENDKLSLLSKQELVILQLLSTGLSNKEIAIQLDVSERTVKNHLYNLYKKIGCSDRTQASLFAIRNLADKID